MLLLVTIMESSTSPSWMLRTMRDLLFSSFFARSESDLESARIALSNIR
jgi:hypothetical protein